jgi:hypothetical protein
MNRALQRLYNLFKRDIAPKTAERYKTVRTRVLPAPKIGEPNYWYLKVIKCNDQKS